MEHDWHARAQTSLNNIGKALFQKTGKNHPLSKPANAGHRSDCRPTIRYWIALPRFDQRRTIRPEWRVVASKQIRRWNYATLSRKPSPQLLACSRRVRNDPNQAFLGEWRLQDGHRRRTSTCADLQCSNCEASCQSSFTQTSQPMS
jgi:hypothetical protein